MTILSDSEIRAVCEQPSQLPASASADEYQMEKYQRVAIESAAAMMAYQNVHILGPGKRICPQLPYCPMDCRRCWREWLEAQ